MPDGPVENEIPTYKEIGRQTAVGQADSGYIEKFHDIGARYTLALWAEIVEPLLRGFLRWAIELGGGFVVGIIQTLDKAKQEARGPFLITLGSVLDNTFDKDITGPLLAADAASGGRGSINEVVGAAIQDSILEDVRQAGRLSPELAERTARRMLGIGIAGTLESWATGVIGELVTMGQVEQICELPNALGTAADFGIFTRTGLTPLVNTVVRDPWEWKLNSTFRTRLLGVSDSVRAFLRGRLSRDEFETILARQGFDSSLLEPLINNSRRFITDTDIFLLRQANLWSEAEGIQHLRDSGYDERTAKAAVGVEELRRVRRLTDEYVNVLERLAKERFISFNTFRLLLEEVPWTRMEKEWELALVGVQLEFPTKSLTLGQMRTAFLDGIVNLAEWEQFLRAEGYSQDDRDILTIQLLLDAKQDAEARRAKEDREQRRKEQEAAAAAGGSSVPA